MRDTFCRFAGSCIIFNMFDRAHGVATEFAMPWNAPAAGAAAAGAAEALEAVALVPFVALAARSWCALTARDARTTCGADASTVFLQGRQANLELIL